MTAIAAIRSLRCHISNAPQRGSGRVHKVGIVALAFGDLFLELFMDRDFRVRGRQVRSSSAPVVVENTSQVPQLLHQPHGMTEGIFGPARKMYVEQLRLHGNSCLLK